MPYIGNTAGNRFVASQAATRLSGNGSAVAFTLEHSVSSDEDIFKNIDSNIVHSRASVSSIPDSPNVNLYLAISIPDLNLF